ncbi:hypothetical protein [Actinophytocola algeriensis]|uniref:Uncharacterized protein n=1 Tax=Actinophytocola algeriensis TaxID=1768010 RepID=A0A7W7QC63_9PSEU|nr:hypothetical protein [Actinophytocola algeriensis]MBB4910436.1 hypothetical protein [Actinophytocola algeriensis]MBE1480575.1 hypothetical protein [Actinophytocola algeriensis]
MTGEVTVPLLPCAAVDDMVAFYDTLGFRRTSARRSRTPTSWCGRAATKILDGALAREPDAPERVEALTDLLPGGDARGLGPEQ